MIVLAVVALILSLGAVIFARAAAIAARNVPPGPPGPTGPVGISGPPADDATVRRIVAEELERRT